MTDAERGACESGAGCANGTNDATADNGRSEVPHLGFN
jgi:hypothetical protein